MRPTVAEIDRSALLTNYNLLTRRAGMGAGAGLIAVVKANAYGHGLALCARSLAGEGQARWLGVTCVDEAVELRTALGSLRVEGERPRVLVMSGFFPGEEGLVLANGLTAQLWEGYHFALLDAAARRAGLGPKSVPVHLELETGMGRQGVAVGEALAELLRNAGFAGDSPLFVDGVMTHFSSPDVLGADGGDGAVMTAQIARFQTGLEQLREAGITPRWVHAGNSANAGWGVGLAALRKIAKKFGAEAMVRPGLALYGVETEFCAEESGTPAGRVSTFPKLEMGNPDLSQNPALRPVMRWKTEVTSLREAPAGATVGYNETFVAGRPTRLALLPVGYADGLNRKLSNVGEMLVRGRRVRIAGRISMDQTVLDVSDVPDVALGDEVVVLGTQGTEHVPVEEHARRIGTIPYEVLCAVSARVRRV